MHCFHDVAFLCRAGSKTEGISHVSLLVIRKKESEKELLGLFQKGPKGQTSMCAVWTSAWAEQRDKCKHMIIFNPKAM